MGTNLFRSSIDLPLLFGPYIELLLEFSVEATGPKAQLHYSCILPTNPDYSRPIGLDKQNPPPLITRVGLLRGGTDETRTRDLRLDRPGFRDGNGGQCHHEVTIFLENGGVYRSQATQFERGQGAYGVIQPDRGIGYIFQE